MSDPRFQEYVQLLFATLKDNSPRIMEESMSNYDGALHGNLGVDGSSVPGYASVNHSDVSICPDNATLRLFNYAGDCTGLAISTVIDPKTKKPHAGDPRSILINVIKKAEEMGFTADAFSELEFFVLKDGQPQDQAGYLEGKPKDKGGPYRKAFANLAKDMGIKVKRIHHECAGGQNEMEFQLTDMLYNADSTLLGMWISALVASEMDLEVEYDPKPYQNEAGNGLHMHLLLKDLDGNNVMYDANDSEGLSVTARKFIAGLLKYSPEVTAVFGRKHSTFERLVPGHEAPVYQTWDFSNRTALVRVPYVPHDAAQKQRVEFRAGDASGSFYLLAAAIYLAGLKGIEEDLEPVANFTENPDKMTPEELAAKGVKRLPSSLAECSKILGTSPFH
ncbi:hypothetical protein GEMRC1_013746 [Eukaryota sp. GEM-RC1]